MNTRKTVSFFQYPYPAEPRNWTEEERAYGRGLKRLFDILFSRKLQNVLIADKAVNARTIDDGAVQLHHLREGFGTDLDITENESVTTLETGVAQAQSTADGAVTAAAAAQQTADRGVSDASNAMQAASDAQDTADGAVTAAAAAQSTADDAVTAAAAAQSTADGAVTAAAAAQSTADDAVTAAAAAQQTASTAQQTADGLTDKLMPVGITVITPTSPSYGTWSQTEVGGMTAWTRIA